MKFIILKYLITAAIVVVVSEVAKRSDKLGAFISALPMVTVLVLCWLYFEGQSQQKISNHAWYTFWYVLPTLPMFAAFPLLLPRFGFALTLLASVVITAVCFFITALFARRLGVHLI